MKGSLRFCAEEGGTASPFLDRIRGVELANCKPKVCLMKLPNSGDSPEAEPAPFLPFRAIDGGGLLIHSDPFALIDSHLFC
jgi:hypothetical protein